MMQWDSIHIWEVEFEKNIPLYNTTGYLILKSNYSGKMIWGNIFILSPRRGYIGVYGENAIRYFDQPYVSCTDIIPYIFQMNNWLWSYERYMSWIGNRWRFRGYNTWHRMVPEDHQVREQESFMRYMY